MNKGFTLVELLVVIAIIGMLASIVVASVNQARDKGFDAGIKGNLSGLRTQAALYYDEHGQSYGATAASCTAANTVFTDATVAQQIVSAQNDAGTNATCANTPDAWAVSVPLRQGGSWCVDSSGTAASTTANTTTATCD